MFIIDLGAGQMIRMYQPEAERRVTRCEMTQTDMLYSIGRTVWEVWDPEFLLELRVPMDGSLPEVIEKIVRECCSEAADSALRVVDMWQRYRNELDKLLVEG
jgi:hypothetical protein